MRLLPHAFPSFPAQECWRSITSSLRRVTRIESARAPPARPDPSPRVGHHARPSSSVWPEPPFEAAASDSLQAHILSYSFFILLAGMTFLL